MPVFQISVFGGRQQTDEAKKKHTAAAKLLNCLIVLFLKALEIFILQSSSGHLSSSEFLNYFFSVQILMSICAAFNTVGTLALIALKSCSSLDIFFLIIKILAAEFCGCSQIGVCDKLYYLGEVEEKIAQVYCTPSSYFSSYLFSKAYA